MSSPSLMSRNKTKKKQARSRWQGEPPYTLKLEAPCSSETSIDFQLTTEDISVQCSSVVRSSSPVVDS
jgi:hypothetical protein